MPLYLYRCLECDTEREVTHLMSEDPEIFCEKPGCFRVDSGHLFSNLMERVITPSSANFVLKGNGYYSTDSRKINCAEDVLGKGIQTDPRGKAI